jgi:hypothetical protein
MIQTIIYFRQPMNTLKLQARGKSHLAQTDDAKPTFKLLLLFNKALIKSASELKQVHTDKMLVKRE